MFDYNKYRKMYFMPPSAAHDWVKRDSIEEAPIWCSVDLRDGNQALITPMNLGEKLELFQLLLEIGFKEIEVAFPAASDTEFMFLRTLIEEQRIPEDVTIQVITQAREHIIRRTFEALEGVPKAIVHLYNSTSEAQRRQVFCKSREEVKQIALEGAKWVKEYAEKTKGNFFFQYSPESFPGTEVDYAMDICNHVLEIWEPTPACKAYINIPTTVENAMPHVFASQLEYINRNLNRRSSVILSVHPHNDRGCGVCDAEFGILAGAQRVEGTLFGNGERTGNVDLITVAMNLYSQGVDPKLDFSRMPEICEAYERLTKMRVNERQPYSGALVFTAFSGSHQDAIAKGMNYREREKPRIWDVPYIPVDPVDLGRNYETDVIRINSQSGKGGVGYLLQNNYGIKLPYKMNEALGYMVKKESDVKGKELSAEEIYKVFRREYLDFLYSPSSPGTQSARERTAVDLRVRISDCRFDSGTPRTAFVTLLDSGCKKELQGTGTGGLDAVNNALKTYIGKEYQLEFYEEHSLGSNASAQAIAYVGIEFQGRYFWGAGMNEDIMAASIDALTVAVNRLEAC